MKRFGAIIVGDEILSGRRSDKHLAKIIELLGARGLALSWARYVGDDRPAIADAIRASAATDDAVFVTGGIGATPDDQTRQAAAEAFGLAIELHAEARELIQQRIVAANAELEAAGKAPLALDSPEHRQRLRMGEFPVGATLVPNPYNRIPGFTVAEHHFVPGFPVMAWPMIEWVLDQRYAHLFHAAPQSARSVLVFETAESRVTPLMESIEARFPGIRVFSLPSVGDATAKGGKRMRRHIELGVKGPVADVDPAFAALEEGLRAIDAPFEPDDDA